MFHNEKSHLNYSVGGVAILRKLSYLIAIFMLGAMLSACSASTSTVNQASGVTSGESKEINKSMRMWG